MDIIPLVLAILLHLKQFSRTYEEGDLFINPLAPNATIVALVLKHESYFT